MKTFFLFRASLAIVLMSLLITSCSKKESDTQSSPQETAALASIESDVEADIISNDVFENVMGVNSQVAVGGSGVFAGIAPRSSTGVSGVMGIDTVGKCYTVTVTNLNQGSIFPVQVVIDFGDGCVGRDGRTRKGKMITVYTKRLVMFDAVATTTFDGYSINGIGIEGSHVITNTSSINGVSYSIDVDGKLTDASGDFADFQSEKVIRQTEGNGTPLNLSDDVYAVNGAASGVTKKGANVYNWSTNITSPLVKKIGCRWLIKGIIEVSANGTKLAEFDYGSGDCDNEAALKVGNRVRIITLY